MRLKSKLFWSLFLSCFIISTSITLISYSSLINSADQQNQVRYQELISMIGDTLTRLENSAENISLNALYLVREIEKQKGLPSTEELKLLSKQLNVSHLYITDKAGMFIRSTETPLEVVNHSIFSFCKDYELLITGDKQFQKTPILPSYPYNGPFKFTMIPNYNRTRILEAGIQLRYLGKLLHDAIHSDPSIDSIGFYTPTGFRLGSIDKMGTVTDGGTIEVPHNLANGVSYQGDTMLVFRKINASQTDCCECIQKGIANTGVPYFYFLKAEISLQSLMTHIKQIRFRLILIFTASLLLSLFLSRCLSSALISKLEKIKEWTSAVVTSGEITQKSNVTGKDEISELASHFESIMSDLARSKKQLVEIEKSKSLSDLASQVAHDIRSPLTALFVATEDISLIPESKRVLIHGEIDRIKDISNSLLEKYQQQRENGLISKGQKNKTQNMMLVDLLDNVLSEKRVQYSLNCDVIIRSEWNDTSYGLFSDVDPNEFKTIISNLINNSIEAKRLNEKIIVTVNLVKQESNVIISIQDTGCGMATNISIQAIERGFTHEKEKGSGLGLFHANDRIINWGGQLIIESNVQIGTTIKLILPLAHPPSWFLPTISVQSNTTIFVLDDDPTIHNVWKNIFSTFRLSENGINIIHAYSGNEFKALYNPYNKISTPFLFLIDCELRDEKKSGIEIIQELQIQNSSVLVTNNSEEEFTRWQCSNNNIRLLSKNLVPLIPILIISK